MRDRTADLYNAIVALSQLSYGPNLATALDDRLPWRAEYAKVGRWVQEKNAIRAVNEAKNLLTRYDAPL